MFYNNAEHQRLFGNFQFLSSSKEAHELGIARIKKNLYKRLLHGNSMTELNMNCSLLNQLYTVKVAACSYGNQATIICTQL